MSKVFKAAGKIITTVVGVGLAVIGVVTGNPYLIAAGLAVTAASLLPKPKIGGGANQVQEARLSKRLEPEANRKIVFGQTAAPVDVRYWEAYGPDNSRYVEVAAVATHKVHAFGDTYFNDEVGVSGGAPTGNWSSVLSFEAVNEGATGAGVTPVGASGKWTASASMTGLAYVVLDWVYVRDKIPNGIPNRITQVVQGAPVYDPRRDISRGGTHDAYDQTTWEYAPLDSNSKHLGRNNALQMLWYQLGWRINGKLVAGRGVDPTDLDMDAFIQAANDCEAQEWYSDCVLSTGDSHSQNEGVIAAASGGRLLDTGGLISYWVVADDTANIAATFTADDIIGAVSWVPRDKLAAQFNEVAGSYVEPSALYQSMPYTIQTESSYVAYLGFRKRKTLDFGAVQDPEQAGKLAKYYLNRGQLQGVFKATFNYRAFLARNWQCVKLTFARYGWTEKLFRITQQEITPQGIAMTLEEEDPAAYVGGVIVIPDGPSTGSGDDPRQQIAVIGASVQAISKASGLMTQDGLRLNWTRPSTRVARSEVQYRKNGTTDGWTMAGTIERGGADLDGFANTDSAELWPLPPDTAFDVRVRHVSVFDVPGPWTMLTGTTGTTTSFDESLTGADGFSVATAIADLQARTAELNVRAAEATKQAYDNGRANLELFLRSTEERDYVVQHIWDNGVPVKTLIQNETAARVDGEAVAVAKFDAIGVFAGDNSSVILNSTKVKLSPTESIGQRFSLIDTTFGNVNATISAESVARANADSAMASTISLLGAVNGGMTAFILDTSRVQIGGGESLSTRLTSINSSMGANTTAINNEITARTNGDSANASSISSLTSSVGSLSATVSTYSSTLASHDGKLQAYMEFMAAAGGDPAYARLMATPTGSAIVMAATEIALYNTSGGSIIRALKLISGQAFFGAPISIDAGGRRLTLGPGFGASGDLVMWFGPSSTSVGSMTKTNGYWAFATDGKVYYGTGELGAGGAFAAAASTPAVSGGRTGAGSATTSSVTISVTGGSGNYSYYWNGALTPTASASSATTSFTAYVVLGQTKEGMMVCTVNDNTTGKQTQVAVYALVTEYS